MGQKNSRGFVEMKNLNRCPICNSKKIKWRYQNWDKNLKISKKKFNLFKCLRCKVIFINPSPKEKELVSFYPKKDYYSLGKIDRGRKANFKVKLSKIYFGNGNFFEKILFSPFVFLVRGKKVKRGMKILDVGSGSGQFLYEMKKLGLETYGLEPGNFNKSEAKKDNLKIERNSLEKTKYKKNSFDIITLNHVLEHLNRPYEALSRVKGLLREDGILIIGIPNSRSLAHFIFGKNWYQLDTPRHLFNYSPKNIKYLLERAGLKVIKKRFNSRPSQFVVSLRYLLGFNKKFEKILDIIFLPLTWIVNAMKVGDQIEVWCEKV